MNSYTIEYSSLGLIAIAETCYNRPSEILFIDLNLDENTNIINISTVNNTTIDTIAIGNRDSIVKEINFSIDRKIGCEKFKIVLSKMPRIYLNKVSLVSFSINGERLYLGEVNELNDELENKNNDIVISGTGLNDRLKKLKIINKYKYSIASVTKSGVDIIINTSTSIDIAGLGGSLIGLKVIVKDNDVNNNNGTGTIIAYTSNSITINKPNGQSSSNPIGSISILHPIWSNSVLVSDLVKYTLSEYLYQDVIKYDPDKIETTAGKLTLGAIDLDGFTFDKFFNLVRNMLDGGESNVYRFYIDEFGYCRLYKIQTDIIDKYFIGYQVNNYEIKYDHSNIANSVSVMRQKARTGVGNGFRLAGYAESISSIKNVGLYSYEEQVPGFFDNTLGQAYAESILESRKEPKVNLSVKDMKFKKYEFGTYSVVSAFDDFTLVLNDCESLSDFTAESPIIASLDSVNFVEGARSIKLEFNEAADGKKFFYTFSPKRLFTYKKIIFYVKSNAIGHYIKFGIGNILFTENLFDIAIDNTSYFTKFEIDLSSIYMSEIGQFGFLFHSLNVGSYVVNIDYITIVEYTAKHMSFPLKKVNYFLTSSGNFCNLDFGSNISNPNLGEFLANVKAQIETTKLNLKE